LRFVAHQAILIVSLPADDGSFTAHCPSHRRFAEEAVAVSTIHDLILPTAEHVGWKADRITDSCFGVQTGFGAVRLLFVRAAEGTSGSSAVLDLCLPLATEVDDDAVREMVGVNGAGAQIVSSAWFSDYEGADGKRHLGAFVRVPVPPMLLDARPLGEMLRGALDHLGSASMMFGRYLEHCEDTSRAPGCRPVRDEGMIFARPADPFERDES